MRPEGRTFTLPPPSTLRDGDSAPPSRADSEIGDRQSVGSHTSRRTSSDARVANRLRENLKNRSSPGSIRSGSGSHSSDRVRRWAESVGRDVEHSTERPDEFAHPAHAQARSTFSDSGYAESVARSEGSAPGRRSRASESSARTTSDSGDTHFFPFVGTTPSSFASKIREIDRQIKLLNQLSHQGRITGNTEVARYARKQIKELHRQRDRLDERMRYGGYPRSIPGWPPNVLYVQPEVSPYRALGTMLATTAAGTAALGIIAVGTAFGGPAGGLAAAGAVCLAWGSYLAARGAYKFIKKTWGTHRNEKGRY